MLKATITAAAATSLMLGIAGLAYAEDEDGGELFSDTEQATQRATSDPMNYLYKHTLGHRQDDSPDYQPSPDH